MESVPSALYRIELPHHGDRPARRSLLLMFTLFPGPMSLSAHRLPGAFSPLERRLLRKQSASTSLWRRFNTVTGRDGFAWRFGCY
jgi:hypothetical protein